MSSTKTVTNNNRTVTFNPNGHSYIDDRGHRYASVTTLLKDYFTTFDADSTATRMEAQGHGAREDLKKAWTEKGAAACRYGTRCHETAEAILLGQNPPHQPESEKERKSFGLIWDYCQSKILTNKDVSMLGTELIVFSPRHYVAGTIDLALRHGGNIHLLDWKTNEKIDTVGYRGAKGIGPLSRLPDCAMTKYAMQLNIYEKILRDEQYIDANEKVIKALLWVTDTVQYIPIPNLLIETEGVMRGIESDFTCGVGRHGHTVSTAALRKVRAIQDDAIAKGWTTGRLYNTRGRFPYPYGTERGLVCYIQPDEEIGEVSREHIELIRNMGYRTQIAPYSNYEVLTKGMSADQVAEYDERAAIMEDGGASTAQAESAASKAVIKKRHIKAEN